MMNSNRGRRKKMKVGMYYNNNDVRLENMAVPSIGDSDLLMEVNVSGICGSDIMEWYRIQKAPLVLGHEVTGNVVELGKNVAEFRVGDRIFATHHVPCDDCHYCLRGHHTACETFHSENNFDPGGFAQYLRITGKSVTKGTLKLPDSVSFEQGAFIEPLGTVVRGSRAAEVQPGDSMLILGSGLVGLLHIKLARAEGAGRIIATDMHESRLRFAEEIGADHTIDASADVPSLVREVNEGNLVDKVIVCTGASSAATQGLKSVDKGGTVLFFAVPKPGVPIAVDINAFWRDDISVKVSYGAGPADNEQALSLISAGKVTVTDMITHRLSLDAIGEGFRLANEGADSLKVMIEPNRSGS
ncbi:MAG: alcohol dehydrogenase catalytic domain-containing protein [Candidatus Poribacteria bacterium]|nr:alcohol dehydrogenase catalytic domain-containing protein [Candidatus Poribacteria bacterium]